MCCSGIVYACINILCVFVVVFLHGDLKILTVIVNQMLLLFDGVAQLKPQGSLSVE